MGVGSVGAERLRGRRSLSRKTSRAYQLTPPRWTPGLKLRLAVLADLHVCEPWMSIERLEGIVEQTNRLGADAILLLGDYVVGRSLGKYSTPVSAGTWATVLAKLKAPLGVHAVLGNHDWWDEIVVQRRRAGPDPRRIGAASRRHSGLRKQCRAARERRPAVLDRGPRRPVGLLADATTSTTNSCEAAKSIITASMICRAR